MRTIILPILLLICSIGWGQQTDKELIEKGNYYFEYVSVQEASTLEVISDLDKSFNLKSIKEEVNGSKYRITVLRTDDNLVHFVFWRFEDDKINKKINNAPPHHDSRIIYTLSKDEFKKSTKPLYNRVEWRVGIFTVPFKLRFKDFNFDANVNIGTNIGAKIRFNREMQNGFSVEPILGIGLASIKLDDSNSTTGSATNVSAFSINTGLLFHITEEINLGLTYGFDNISSTDQNKYNWKHNGRGWLGIGINLAFSNPSKNTRNAGTNES